MTEEQSPDTDVVETALENPEKRVALGHSGLMWIAVAISVAFLLIIAFNLFLYFRVDSLVDDNEKSIAKLRQIQQPTPKEFEDQFEEGLKRCARSKRCRDLFPELARAGDTLTRKERAADRRRSKRSSRTERGSDSSGGSSSSSSPTPSGGDGRRSDRASGGEQPRRPAQRPSQPPSSGAGGGGGASGGSGGSSGGGSSGGGGGNPPVVRTPEVQTPQVGPIPSTTVPSIEVPCVGAEPVVTC